MTKPPPLRPSSTDRWLRCPGTADYGHVRDGNGEFDSIEARLGTELHKLVEAKPRTRLRLIKGGLTHA